MSLIGSAIRESQCDFPSCEEPFGTEEGAKIAIIKDGEILAFCVVHRDRLMAEGIKLRSLAEIHAEHREAKDRPVRERQALEQAAREIAFIKGLKS